MEHSHEREIRFEKPDHRKILELKEEATKGKSSTKLRQLITPRKNLEPDDNQKRNPGPSIVYNIRRKFGDTGFKNKRYHKSQYIIKAYS